MHADSLMRTYAYLCPGLNHPNYYNGLGVRVRKRTKFKLAPIMREILLKRQRIEISDIQVYDD